MSDRAWMPLYIADYLADTGHLNAAEHGAYLMLIMHYWQKGSLPSDERLLARIGRMTPDQWAESRDVLAMLFGPDWTHKRVDAERVKADSIIAKRKAAADARHSRSKSDADAVHVHSKRSDTGALPITNNLSEPSGSDAAGVDPRDELWSEGVSILKATTGKTDGAARAVIGKWCRDAGDDCALVLQKLRAAQRDRIGDPVAWVTAAIKPPDKPPPKPRNAGEAARMELRKMGMMNDVADQSTGRLGASDGGEYPPGPGHARRIAIAPG